ncbi:MAG: DUF1801 domain-containing protein [Dehalococcoidia bacterium]
MAKAANFHEWVADLDPAHRVIAQGLRNMLLEVEPNFQEAIKWGQPTFTAGGAARCYIADQDNYVHLGFYNGASLSDPHGLIDGTGKRMRHIKVHNLDEDLVEKLRAYVRESLSV